MTLKTTLVLLALLMLAPAAMAEGEPADSQGQASDNGVDNADDNSRASCRSGHSRACTNGRADVETDNESYAAEYNADAEDTNNTHVAFNGASSDEAARQESQDYDTQARASASVLKLPALPPYCSPWLVIRVGMPYFEPDCLIP